MTKWICDITLAAIVVIVLAWALGSSAHAGTATITCEGSVLTVTTTATTPPAPTLPPTVPPAPPPSGIPAGCPTPPDGTMVFLREQRDNLTNISFDWVFAHPGLTLDSAVPANSSKSHPFINPFPSSSKAGGKIDMAQGNRGTNTKDISISDCPGRFDNLPPGCARLGYLTSAIYWTFNGAKYAGVVTACKIEPGKQYYLNIRPSVAGQDAGYAINSQ